MLCFVKTLWLTAASSYCLWVLAWVGFQSIPLDHLWAVEPLGTMPSLAPPIRNRISREQSGKARRGPGSLPVWGWSDSARGQSPLLSVGTGQSVVLALHMSGVRADPG